MPSQKLRDKKPPSAVAALVRRVSATALLVWFLALAISPLWGAHVHHTESTEAGCVDAIRAHLTRDSKENFKKKANDPSHLSALRASPKGQGLADAHKGHGHSSKQHGPCTSRLASTHESGHCRMEPLLKHLLENALLSSQPKARLLLLGNFLVPGFSESLGIGSLILPGSSVAFLTSSLDETFSFRDREKQRPGLARAPPF